MSYQKRIPDNAPHGTVNRAVEIEWHPRGPAEWQTFTSARREAGRLWGEMVGWHWTRRQLQLPWLTKQQWREWASGQGFALHSQTIQELIDQFIAAERSTMAARRAARARGDGVALARARYPKPRRSWKDDRLGYRDVPYKNNQARFRDGKLVLPNCGSGDLKICLPKGIVGHPDGWVTVLRGDAIHCHGRLMGATLQYGKIRLVLEVNAAPPVVDPPVIGVDLGVNTLLAAGDEERAVLVSGRGVKAILRERNRQLVKLVSRQARKQKGSRRWRKLQRAKRQMLAQTRRRVKNALHEASRRVADAFPGAIAYVGKPFNDAARRREPTDGRKQGKRRLRRAQAQQVSQAANSQLRQMLEYKLGAVVLVDEPYTSQTCPVCGALHKCGRTYRCECGFTAPRDVVGLANIRSRGMHGEIRQEQAVPKKITYLRLKPLWRNWDVSRPGIRRLAGLVTPPDVRGGMEKSVSGRLALPLDPPAVPRDTPHPDP